MHIIVAHTIVSLPLLGFPVECEVVGPVVTGGVSEVEGEEVVIVCPLTEAQINQAVTTLIINFIFSLFYSEVYKDLLLQECHLITLVLVKLFVFYTSCMQ